MLSDWLRASLTCPRDSADLTEQKDVLVCAHGHRYPVIQGVPIFLIAETEPTHPYVTETLRATAQDKPQPDVEPGPDHIDAFVQDEILKTNGFLYQHLLGKLPRYPIPRFPMAPNGDVHLLDVGCNWGRWSLAAAKVGFKPVGVDPSLRAVLAAQRVAKQLGLDAEFIVGDARQLPFKPGRFDASFSYSVLQHFSKSDARAAWRQMALAARPQGRVLLQMPNRFGLRQAYNQVRQKLAHDQNPFRVRYWTPSELLKAGNELVGPSELRIDGFFSLNPQATDLDLMPPRYAAVIRVSERLRGIAKYAPALEKVADSLYVDSVRR